MKFKLAGQRIHMVPLSLAELNSNYVSWLNDEEVCKYTHHGIEYFTHNDAIAFINSLNGNGSKKVWAIYVTDSSIHIGNISLQQIDSINKKAEIAMLIGGKTEWNKGYGTEAVRIIVEYGFGQLLLHRIYAGVRSDNMGMITVFEKCGFIREGILKDSVFKNGKFYDAVVYGIISKHGSVQK